MNTQRTGARTPFFCDDITHYVSVAAADFSPIENVPAGTLVREDTYIKNGFLAMNATATAGLLYCITWQEFQLHRLRSNRNLVTNTQVLALCTPVAIYVSECNWTMTPIVKIFAGTNQTYPTTVVTVNIGTIR